MLPYVYYTYIRFLRFRQIEHHSSKVLAISGYFWQVGPQPCGPNGRVQCSAKVMLAVDFWCAGWVSQILWQTWSGNLHSGENFVSCKHLLNSNTCSNLDLRTSFTFESQLKKITNIHSPWVLSQNLGVFVGWRWTSAPSDFEKTPDLGQGVGSSSEIHRAG